MKITRKNEVSDNIHNFWKSWMIWFFLICFDPGTSEAAFRTEMAARPAGWTVANYDEERRICDSFPTEERAQGKKRSHLIVEFVQGLS